MNVVELNRTNIRLGERNGTKKRFYFRFYTGNSERKRMKIKRIAVYATLAAVLLLLVVPADAKFGRAYPAQIHATGTLTLYSMTVTPGEEGFPDLPVKSVLTLEDGTSLPIDVTFVSTVPNSIEPGTYEAEFVGFAAAGRGMMKFSGILKVGMINFWVQFALEKPEETEVLDGLYSASGSLEITISTDIPPPPEVTWVLVKGRVKQFDDADAFGNLIAHAKKGGDNEWTQVHVVFSLEPPPLADEELTPGTYSHSFYVITLANATLTELNNGENDLYIEGTFNVYKRTHTITVEDSTKTSITIEVETIVEGASGSLAVTFEPPLFTLDIDGFGVVTGSVAFFHVKYAKPFERGIPRGDFNIDRVVNIGDLVKVAKAFRAELGQPGYNFDFDFNSDFRINIVDLSAAALEFGQEY
jgi:hypothetical protein